MLSNKLINKILKINSINEFNDIALEIFQYQYKKNKIYRKYIDFNHFKVEKINHFSKIPFLPIELFKSQKIFCGIKIPEFFFESSGTSGIEKSKHYISDLTTYEQSFLNGFNYFYGNIKDYNFLALLPSYLEQKHSSLIYMIDRLIIDSNNKESGFYLYNLENLYTKLKSLRNGNKKIILFGVTYALLDLAEKYPINISNAIIFETGGMKGRRKEMIKEEVHNQLKSAFNVSSIHGEYGMTELFSQAYSDGGGIFKTPPWMKVLIRDTDDPYSLLGNNKSGGINVIDLANIDTCCFIATQDLGKTYNNESFEVSGRFDNSDIRGCNLMVI